MILPDTRKHIARYGLWNSPFDIVTLFSRPAMPMYPFEKNGQLYWLEALPKSKGRITLMSQWQGKPCNVLAAPFNIRTQVHEYGGRCFCLVDDALVFNHFGDGHLYIQPLTREAQPMRLTTHGNESPIVGYADLVASPDNDFVIAVCEWARPGGMNENGLVAIPVNARCPQPAIPQVIVSGKDFYSTPSLSRDGTQLAWIEWDNPHMPWDQSRLCRGVLGAENGQFTVLNTEALVDQPDQTVCQIDFLPDRSLLFVSDSPQCNFWNLFHHQAGRTTQLTDRDAEFGEPHWQFGQHRWQWTGNQRVIAVETTEDGDQIVAIDLQSKAVTVLQQGFAVCCQLNFSEQRILFVAGYVDRDPEVLALDPFSGETTCLKQTDTPGRAASANRPKPIHYPTRDGDRAYAYFYAPSNPAYDAPAGDKPPLMVLVHGGPSTRTTPEYTVVRQYFLSLGYALLDVNYRGSTGYGRRYRQQLLGRWGEIDVSDIADGVASVIQKGWVDERQIFIRGSSAGGYAVLCALTRYADLFSGGACYYGIGNLITLAEITHKFEGKYIDQLIGEPYDPTTATNPESRFTARSPVFEMDRVNSPLILFQGLDDKVVPPEVSREVVTVLQEKGLKYEYIEYPGEGHGFRASENRIDALTREVAFFSAIIKGQHER